MEIKSKHLFPKTCIPSLTIGSDVSVTGASVVLVVLEFIIKPVIVSVRKAISDSVTFLFSPTVTTHIGGVGEIKSVMSKVQTGFSSC